MSPSSFITKHNVPLILFTSALVVFAASLAVLLLKSYIGIKYSLIWGILMIVGWSFLLAGWITSYIRDKFINTTQEKLDRDSLEIRSFKKRLTEIHSMENSVEKDMALAQLNLDVKDYEERHKEDSIYT